jgi:MFS family permease
MKGLLTEEWRTLHWPTAVGACFSIAASTANFFLPVYFKSELGFTGSQIGLLYALFSVTTLLAVVPIGFRNDRSSPRVLVAASLVLTSAAALGMAAARGFVPYLTVFLFYGLGLSAFRISLDALMFKTGNGQATGRRFGWFNAFRMVGFGLGTVGAGYVLKARGFPGTLVLIAAIAFVTLFMIPLLSSAKVGFPRLRDYVADFRGQGILAFVTWLFLFSLHWGAEMTSYGLFLRERLELSLAGMGWYMGAEYLVLAAACLWAGMRYDRGFDLRTLAIPGLVLSGLGQFLMCVPVLWFSVLWRCIHGIGDGLIVIVFYVGVARLFNLSRIGGHSSVANLVMMMGSFFGSLAFGPLGQRFGYDKPLMATGVLALLLALPVALRRRSGLRTRPSH